MYTVHKFKVRGGIREWLSNLIETSLPGNIPEFFGNKYGIIYNTINDSSYYIFFNQFFQSKIINMYKIIKDLYDISTSHIVEPTNIHYLLLNF